MTKRGDLYREGVLLPFEEFSVEFELPIGDFLIHGALTAAIRAHWQQGITEPPLHRGTGYVVTSAGKHKAVTYLYRQ